MTSRTDTASFNTEIVLGKDLPDDVIDMMVSQRIKEYGENTKDFRNNERDSVFFFLKSGNEIKAFGMLKPVTIYYQEKPYHIMGVANVMATEKSKGLGSVLMEQITAYLREHDLTAIGNTHADNFGFYQKCGYRFVPGLLPRFVYQKENGEKERTETQDYDMFCYDPNNRLLEIFDGSEPVFIKVPLW